MTKQEFLEKLKQKLLDAGLAPEACDQRCAAISRGFSKLTEDEARQYFTPANVDMIADRLLEQAGRKQSGPVQSKAAADPKESEQSKETAQKDEQTKEPDKKEEQPEVNVISDGNSTPKPTIVIPKSKGKTPGSEKEGEKSDSETPKASGSGDVVFVNKPNAGAGTAKRGLVLTIDDSVMSRGSGHPKLLLAAIIALCAPMALFLVLSVLGLSLGIALLMASTILVVVFVIAVVVCGGSILAVMSLIYGITQIISEPRYVGLHEIGLAMLFSGVTILISVLLYNLAVRLIPFIYKLIGIGLRKLYKNSKNLMIQIWKGCKSL